MDHTLNFTLTFSPNQIYLYPFQPLFAYYISPLFHPHLFLTFTQFHPQPVHPYLFHPFYSYSFHFKNISRYFHLTLTLFQPRSIFFFHPSPISSLFFFTLTPYFALFHTHPYLISPSIYSSSLYLLILLVGCDDNVTNVETQYKNIVWNGWYKFDYYVMKPILTHNGPPLTATCPSFCHPITNCFTSHEAYTNHNDDDNEVSL